MRGEARDLSFFSTEPCRGLKAWRVAEAHLGEGRTAEGSLGIRAFALLPATTMREVRKVALNQGRSRQGEVSRRAAVNAMLAARVARGSASERWAAWNINLEAPSQSTYSEEPLRERGEGARSGTSESPKLKFIAGRMSKGGCTRGPRDSLP